MENMGVKREDTGFRKTFSSNSQSRSFFVSLSEQFTDLVMRQGSAPCESIHDSTELEQNVLNYFIKETSSGCVFPLV